MYTPKFFSIANQIPKNTLFRGVQFLAPISSISSTSVPYCHHRAFSSQTPLPAQTSIATETKKGWGRGVGFAIGVTSIYLISTYAENLEESKRKADYNTFAGEYISSGSNKKRLVIIHDAKHNKLVVEDADGAPIELEQITDNRFRNRTDWTDITFNLEPNSNRVHSVNVSNGWGKTTYKRTFEIPKLRVRW